MLYSILFNQLWKQQCHLLIFYGITPSICLHACKVALVLKIEDRKMQSSLSVCVC